MGRKLLWGAGALAALLLAARAALPSLAEDRINESLAGLPGYEGSVEDVDLALWRGAARLEGLRLRDKKGDLRVSIPSLEVDVAWGPLLRKVVVADVAVRRPSVRLLLPKPSKAVEKTKEKAAKAEVVVEEKTGKSLPQLLQEMAPFRIDRFTLEDGVVVAREGAVDRKEAEEKPEQEDRGPGVIRVDEISVLVENLTNKAEAKVERFARGKASARLMESGRFEMKLSLDPTAKAPTFDLNASVKDLDLAALNPILRWQMGVDVSKGRFDLVAEADAAGGGFKGYVKPFITGLEMGERKGGAAKKVKEAVVGAVSKLLRNKETEAVATRVPFSGRFADPEVGVWAAVAEVLRNAFVRALLPRFEGL